MPFEQIEVELLETMGSDFAVASSAWTSSTTHEGQAKKSQEQAEDLVRRLARDGHSVPFESVVFRFWMRLPIFVDRQIMTHRIMSANGMSGRYRTMPEDFYFLPDDVVSILQNLGTYVGNVGWTIITQYYDACDDAMKSYREALTLLKIEREAGRITEAEYKRVREVLRGQCPQAGMTERVMTINLRSWANFQKQRNSEYAQPEIRDIAQKMFELVKAAGVCPVALEALESKGWII